ncbi:MAG: uroporphyrinogen decarboxylase family protein [Clostridia bacterium]|nr:uroporphyrinogen decarboxylase family protein [Clostridia bacterium]
MFCDISNYRPELESCMSRVRAFFSGIPSTSGASDSPSIPSALIYTFPSVLTLKGPSLNQYDFEEGISSYLDDYLSYQAELMDIRRGIDDDWIPSVVPYMGIGEFSAFVAGDIEFGDDTSWAKPVITEKSDLARLSLDPANRWFVRLNAATRYTLEKIAPYRIPLGRGYYSPLDLAWALRGEAIYMDFYEDPEFVHRLMKLATDATIWFASAQIREIFAPQFAHELSAWHCAPNRIAVSEDISSLCSPAHYREFGAPYTQRAFDAFGIGEVHCHSAGPHVMPEFLKLKHLRQIQIVADPNQTRPVQILSNLIEKHPDLFGRSPDKPVIAVDASAAEISDYYGLSKHVRLVFSVVTDTADEATEAVSVFRAQERKYSR